MKNVVQKGGVKDMISKKHGNVLDLSNEKIFVKTVGPFPFVRESLQQKNVEVTQTGNDIGVVFLEAFGVA